jgi:16S rRNA (uracil1498-N3)-methyltransferase
MRRRFGSVGAFTGLIKIDKELAIGQTARVPEHLLRDLQPRAWRVGALITIRDRGGRDFRARVIALLPGHCEALAFEAFGSSLESPVNITLLQALPKRERLESVIQKATELGVYSIIPFESEKSVTLAQRDAPQKKSHRWQHIAVKAAQQCRRTRVPQIHPVVPFYEALDLAEQSSLRLLLWEREPSQDLRTALATTDRRVKSIALVVGPEGGFSPGELEIAREKGYISIGLGRRILKTETAALAAIAILQYQLGDLAGGDTGGNEQQ